MSRRIWRYSISSFALRSLLKHDVHHFRRWTKSITAGCPFHGHLMVASQVTPLHIELIALSSGYACSYSLLQLDEFRWWHLSTKGNFPWPLYDIVANGFAPFPSRRCEICIFMLWFVVTGKMNSTVAVWDREKNFHDRLMTLQLAQHHIGLILTKPGTNPVLIRCRC